MKVHVDADVDSGAVHTVEITAANETDINVLSKLLRAEDEIIFVDAGYTSDEYKLKPGQNLSGGVRKNVTGSIPQSGRE
jgi:IS5 family transposase